MAIVPKLSVRVCDFEGFQILQGGAKYLPRLCWRAWGGGESEKLKKVGYSNVSRMVEMEEDEE